MHKEIKNKVISIVSRQLGVTKKIITSDSRHKRTSRDNLARQIVMYGLHIIFKYSQKETATMLNYSSHGSVIHAVKKIDSELKWNSDIRSCLTLLEQLNGEYDG